MEPGSRKVALHKGKYLGYQSRTDLEARLAVQGYSTFFWQDRPGATYTKHYHDHDEVIVVFAGRIELTIEGEKYCVGEGDELLLPRGTMHEAKNPGPDPVGYFICS
ncbi:MAG: cupin domain-containing protein [Cyanobacteria bacterium]|nr:cupin domain-containing protein [Cyanobacteriota bacterium]